MGLFLHQNPPPCTLFIGKHLIHLVISHKCLGDRVIAKNKKSANFPEVRYNI